MIDIDELLEGASARLVTGTADLTIPPPPRAGRPMMAVAAGGMAAAAIGIVAVGVRHGDPDTEGRALPPGVAEGDFGVEVVLTEIEDGDDDPTTRLYEADRGAGRVSTQVTAEGRSGSATTVAVPAPDAVAQSIDTMVDGEPAVAAPGPQWCITAADGSGLCTEPGSLEPSELIVMVGSRDAGQQAIVAGVADAAAVVTFASGTEKYWTRPVDGFAVFPRTAAQSFDARIEVIGDGGVVLDGRIETNVMPTEAEIRAAAVTTETGVTLVDGWFATLPDDLQVGYGAEIVRRIGRTSPTGYTGPFSMQSLVLGQDADTAGSELWIVTVPSADAAAVSDRLSRATDGRLRDTVDRDGGLTVLVWAGDDVSDASIATAVASLEQRPPLADRSLVLDGPRAWWSETPPPAGRVGGPIEVMLGEVIDTIDGTPIVAQADDLGAINFMAPGLAASTGSPFVPTPALTPETVAPGLFALPGVVASVELETADGSVVTPELVDARPYADATLMIVPSDIGRVVDLVITPG